MSMRTDIYYWKCDCPGSLSQKQASYFKEKYDRTDLADTVRRACRACLGSEPDDLEPLRADGNHIAFTFTRSGRKYFFRADDGAGDDDYMLAESALMRLAAQGGVPVPEVFHTDVSRSASPFRFQLMECRPEPCLDTYHKQGVLDLAAVGTQLGACLRSLHAIRIDGFGFIDTQLLARTGELRGLDLTYAGYFHKRLDDHLDYLEQHALLSGGAVEEVRRLFERHASRLRRSQAVLTHRDMALWNVLGEPGRITAIIDWDDAVGGDPADDIGILRCFYDDDFMGPVLRGYWGAEKPDYDFECRVWLHLLRNMLWKTKLRHALGYFDKGSGFFLNIPGVRKPLREATLERLNSALDRVREMEVS